MDRWPTGRRSRCIFGRDLSSPASVAHSALQTCFMSLILVSSLFPVVFCDSHPRTYLALGVFNWSYPRTFLVSGVFRDRKELEEIGARSEPVERLHETEKEANYVNIC